jgi:hypothetical protein
LEVSNVITCTQLARGCGHPECGTIVSAALVPAVLLAVLPVVVSP